LVAAAWLVASTLIGFTLVFLPAAAQGNEQQALVGAVGLLSRRLGVSITVIDAYTAEVMTFPDTSFGCPVDGRTYIAAPIQGYKFVITYQGVAYDIRTNADGTQGAICNPPAPLPEGQATPAAPLAKQTAGLATYRTSTFSIAYPETWNVVDRTSDTYFGPGSGPACAQPGMLVVALGNVRDKTPDQLLAEYDAELINATLEAERTSVRAIGRSAQYQVKCADGSLRQARVTIFVAYGRGFRVLQFSPQAEFVAWANLFDQIIVRFSPSTVNTVSSAASGAAGRITLPTVSPLALVAHIFAGNVYVGTLVDWPGTPITLGGTPERSFRHVATSPLGEQVAYVDVDGGLWVAHTQAGTGTAPARLAQGVARGYPVAWRPDGRALAYLQADASAPTRLALMAVMLDGNAPARLADLDADAERGQCEVVGGTADALYQAETGPAGNRVTLLWARNGALYLSASCTGRGLLRVANGAVTTLHDQIRRVAFSPDQTQALGLVDVDGQSAAVSLALATGQAMPLRLAAQPDQLAWSAGGRSLYYSSLTLKTTITLDAEVDQERGSARFGVWPFTSPIFTLRLHSFDLTTGVDAVLLETEGRGVGRIAPAPDGSGVLVSVVQSDRALADAFTNNASDAELRRLYPATLVYWLGLPASAPQLVAITSEVTWGPLGSALAPTPTGGYTVPPGQRTFTPTPAPSLTPTPAGPRILPTNTRAP
jgi:hypothetical protein